MNLQTELPPLYLPPVAVSVQRDFLGREITPGTLPKTLADCSFEVQQTAYFAALSRWVDRFTGREGRDESTVPLLATMPGMSSPTIHPAVPAKTPPVYREHHVESVRWLWSHGGGVPRGYILYRPSHGPLSIGHMDARITALLPRAITDQADSIKVKWTCRWHLTGRGETVIDEIIVEDNVSEPTAIGSVVKDIKQQVSEARDAAIASRPATEFDHWIHDIDQRKDYWTKVHSAFNKWQVADKGREDFCHSVLSVEHTDEFKGTKDEAITLITAEVDKVYGKAEACTGAASTSAPTTNPSRASDKAAPLVDTPDSSHGQALPVGVTASELPEAPFSANFHLFHKSGVNIQFAVRTDTVSEGIRRTEVTIDSLLKSGYTVDRPGRSEATANGQATSQPNGDNKTGKSPCFLVKVGKSYNGSKPQLEFEVDGFENPLRFTREKPEQLVKILDKVRKSDGSVITAADMTDGRKFGGHWQVGWEKVEKDGKTYTNVVSVESAA